MSIVSMSPFLRRVLIADALIGVAAGAVMTAGAGALPSLLGLPVSLLMSAGIVLFPWAAFLLWLAGKPSVPRAAVWAVIGCNGMWVIDSVWVSLGGSFEPTALGHAFVAMQALTVAVLAQLEYLGLRRPEGAISSPGEHRTAPAP